MAIQRIKVGLALSLAVVSVSAVADTDIDALRKEIRILQDQVQALQANQQETAALDHDKLHALETLTDRVSFNGFLSVGYSKLKGEENPEALNLYGVKDSVTSQPNMVVGAQMDVAINDRLRTSIQFVSRGVEENELATEWAYFAYRATERLTLRGGRLRTPYYAYSDALDVGYAYPWARPPLEIYNLPVSSFEGFDALYDFPVGDWLGEVQAYYGSVTDSDPVLTGLDFTLDQYQGLVFSLSQPDLTLRVAYHHANATGEPIAGANSQLLIDGLADAQSIAVGLNALGGNHYDTFTTDLSGRRAAFANVAAIYDDSVWFLAAEYAHLWVDYELFPAGDSGYVSFGRHFGRWFPYVMFSTVYADDQDEAPVNDRIAGAEALADTLAGLNIADIDPDPLRVVSSQSAAIGMESLADGLRLLRVQQDACTAGIGYTVMEGLKLKTEITRYNDFGESRGLFGGGSPGDHATVWTFIVNSVF